MSDRNKLNSRTNSFKNISVSLGAKMGQNVSKLAGAPAGLLGVVKEGGGVSSFSSNFLSSLK